MDDPLVPKSNGVQRLLIRGVGLAGCIFVLVVIIFAFLQGNFAWILGAVAIMMLCGSTGMLARWVSKDELEESKHTYLVAFQSLAVVILAAGLMAVILAPPAQTQYLIGGCGSGGSSGGLKLKDDQGEVLTVPGGDCSGFIFDKTYAEGDSYRITIDTQPSNALCTLARGSGTIKEDNILGSTGMSTSCQNAYRLGGTVTLNDNIPAQGISLLNSNGDRYDVVQMGGFFFATPLLAGTSYSVTANAPDGVTCTLTNPSGIIDRDNPTDINTIGVACGNR